MRTETIFEMTSPCRDNFRIKGFRFGEGEKTLAIVGAMRGDEVQQQYICSQLVSRLTTMEQRGGIVKGRSILVIPLVQPVFDECQSPLLVDGQHRCQPYVPWL
jgi:hypothetical protein